jgi:N-acyl-D-aspartate/D-glutamate deacylase
VDFAFLQLRSVLDQFDGRRLMQRADGYVATVVAGQTTIRNDEATGAEPGRLIRGEQFARV